MCILQMFGPHLPVILLKESKIKNSVLIITVYSLVSSCIKIIVLCFVSSLYEQFILASYLSHDTGP